MEEMRDELKGDVLKLQAKGNYYRLRVGNFRVLFLLEGNAIKVYAVKDRKEAYE
jgi:mRNA-degrading endonuclease RelE of RelBE toxin-antitoxin system